MQGTTQIAARAGQMCAQLGVCSTALKCYSLTAASINTPRTNLTGSLDLCAAEGVTGGKKVTLPSASTTASSCRSRSDCGSGQVCYFDTSAAVKPRVCGCEAGNDVCYDIGTCVSYCDLNSTVTQLERLNSGISTCTPTDNGSGTGCADNELCVQVANCQRWQCNAASQSLVPVSCDGKCRPKDLKPLSAKISDDGQSVVVTLNAYATKLSSVPCGRIFDAASSALLGGASAAMCSTSDNTLTAKMGPTAKLMPGNSLTLLTSTSALVGQVDSTLVFTGSVTVDSCTACVVPKVALAGPSAITTPCTDSSSSSSLLQAAGAVPPSFDASLSYDPSGRTTWSNVQWSLADSSGSAGGRATLQAAIDRTNAVSSPNSRLVLSLMTTEANSLPESTYTLQATLTSWLGTSASKTFSFAKTGDDAPPAVKIVGPAVQTFRLSSGMRVSAAVGQVCSGRTLSWLWTSPSGWSAIPEAGSSAQQLYVAAPVAAVHGQDIVLRVNVSYAGISSVAAGTDTVTMTAVGAAPSAKLSGPSGDVADDTTLVFNATTSTDPDTTRDLQSLSYTWDCKREDYPAPCFTGADQGDSTSSPGVWQLAPGLLTSGVLHTITVTVSKAVSQGASPLSATASVSFKPRSTALPFPRGTLSRQCSAAECASPHNTDKDLTLMLVMESQFREATVTWSSAEIDGIAGVNATAATLTDGSPSGTYLLTIPSAYLPTNLAAATITAKMLLNGLDGSAMVTVPLNSAPACTLSDTDDNSACLSVELTSSTFPTAVASVRAQGWSDAQDTQLSYEFGLRVARSDGGSGTEDRAQQLGVISSAALVGLAQGNVTVYCCAIDSQGSRTCGSSVAVILPPSADFDAMSSLSSVDLTQLSESGDQASIIQAAAQISLLTAYMAASSDTGSSSKVASGASAKASDSAVQLASSTATTLVTAILGATNLDDAQQASLALSSIATTVSSSAGLLNDAAKSTVLQAAVSILQGVVDAGGSGSTISSTFCQHITTLLVASTPSNSSSATTAALRLRQEVASSSAATSLEWVKQTLSLTAMMADSLGMQATPGGNYLTVGASGVYVSAAALSVQGSGTSASVTYTIRAGVNAAQQQYLTSSASSKAAARRRDLLQLGEPMVGQQPQQVLLQLPAERRRRVLGTASATATAAAAATAGAVAAAATAAARGGASYGSVSQEQQRLLQVLREDTAAPENGSKRHHRQLLEATSAPPPATPTSSSVSNSSVAEAQIVLSGDAAVSAIGYSVGLSYITAAASELPAALGSGLPTNVTLRSSLVSFTWKAASSDAAASPPSLDGNSSYILLRIPVTAYDVTKVGTCVLYDRTTNNLYGNLTDLQPSTSSPATFIKYDAASGSVNCRITTAGAYVVAQGSEAVAAPPVAESPPPPAAPPAGLVAEIGVIPTTLPDYSSKNPVARPPPPGESSGRKRHYNKAAVAAGTVIGGVALIALIAAYLVIQRKRALAKVAAEPPAAGGDSSSPTSSLRQPAADRSSGIVPAVDVDTPAGAVATGTTARASGAIAGAGSSSIVVRPASAGAAAGSVVLATAGIAATASATLGGSSSAAGTAAADAPTPQPAGGSSRPTTPSQQPPLVASTTATAKASAPSPRNEASQSPQSPAAASPSTVVSPFQPAAPSPRLPPLLTIPRNAAGNLFVRRSTDSVSTAELSPGAEHALAFITPNTPSTAVEDMQSPTVVTAILPRNTSARAPASCEDQE
ncbi:hypothetical protein Agub_g13383 [Astrephomene gubernaculifera]|uniref:PKD/REJ-like domain-containing protein n=1 Tax=Astrephomene gubernaculifera TaxID=47775 RepID=A0AAD3E449_9CHLO|nr:hypothetical protein Agub_g13383 [Astrephomene gubernaculifera]